MVMQEDGTKSGLGWGQGRKTKGRVVVCVCLSAVAESTGVTWVTNVLREMENGKCVRWWCAQERERGRWSTSMVGQSCGQISWQRREPTRRFSHGSSH